MRLDPMPPEKLSAEQRPLHGRIDSGIRKYFQGFICRREDGALVGIFNPLVHYPQFGGTAWDYIMALVGALYAAACPA
jgi:4-carboxymuconolactone decarboxylase